MENRGWRKLEQIMDKIDETMEYLPKRSIIRTALEDIYSDIPKFADVNDRIWTKTSLSKGCHNKLSKCTKGVSHDGNDARNE